MRGHRGCLQMEKLWTHLDMPTAPSAMATLNSSTWSWISFSDAGVLYGPQASSRRLPWTRGQHLIQSLSISRSGGQ